MTLDLNKIAYSLRLLLPNGRELIVDDLIDDLRFEENEHELSSKVRASIRNIKLSDGWIQQHVYLARRIALLATDGNEWHEVFRGLVYKWSYDAKSTLVEFIAYDSMYPFLKSKTHYFCKKNETGATTLKQLAKDWPNISIGTIEGPTHRLAQKVYSSGTIGDIVTDRLEESRKKGHQRFVLRDVKGKLNSIKEGSNKRVFILEGDFVESASDDRSIEDLITRVKVYGTEDDGKKSRVEATRNGKTEFGIIQDVVYSSSYDSLAEARAAANEILREKGQPEVDRTIVSPDIPWVRKGDLIDVSAGSIGRYINGEFKPVHCIVKGVTHDWVTGKMTLSLRGAP